jgi:Coenzyme F390 synthetase
MLIIRGVNVFPSQIETVLLKEGYPPNYMIEVDRVRNTDTMLIRVELPPEQFTDLLGAIQKREDHLIASMREMLGITPKVQLVPPQTIPRSEGKAVRVIDHRKLV